MLIAAICKSKIGNINGFFTFCKYVSLLQVIVTFRSSSNVDIQSVWVYSVFGCTENERNENNNNPVTPLA